MGMRILAVGVATAVLLAPGAAVVGVATLVSPAAAGSGSCLIDATATGSLGVTGDVPMSLSAANSHGEQVILNELQLQRAATIIATGKAADIPARGQLIALMAALTESSLRVLSNISAHPGSAAISNDGDGDDHDSLGLFQMRPSTGWGTVRHLMDPVWSSRAFYGGTNGPNHGSPRGLLDIPDWEDLTPGEAAQAVEVSAYPDRYAVTQPVAEAILSTLSGAALDAGLTCAVDRDGEIPINLPEGFAGALISAAASQLGLPYVWGGGDFEGPTGGGFDCSGLVLYAAYQGSNGQIRLPHYSGDQIRAGRGIPWADKQPGDLIFFSYPGASGPHHVAIYVGGDRILHAPRTGDVVRYGTIGEFAGEVMSVRRLS